MATWVGVLPLHGTRTSVVLTDVVHKLSLEVSNGGEDAAAALNPRGHLIPRMALGKQSKISRARRASSARSVRLFARRIGSARSALVKVIAFFTRAIIVYKLMLYSISRPSTVSDS
jgi:hypothetical protein